MAGRREQLIARLVADLAPVRPVTRVRDIALAWCLFNGVTVAGLLLLRGPFREDSLADLASHPRFLFESALGLAVVLVSSVVVFRLGLPGGASPARQVLMPTGLVTLWIVTYLFGVWSPAFETPLTAERPHCFLETLLTALPGLLTGLLVVRRLWPLYPGWTGFVAGLAAAAVPALLMQFACTYRPLHILSAHLLPVLLVGAAGAVIGAVLLRTRVAARGTA